MPFKVPEKYRIKQGINGMMQSDETFGNNGLFIIKSAKLKSPLTVIASDGADWEHVSVSLTHRTPTWEEMSFVKSLFWDDEDAVIQIHPPKSQYVNNHPYTLHLWRKLDTNAFFEAPHSLLVGYVAHGQP
ncbi:DUF7694 domain-containing protein [Vibrio vulnificus]|uniref:DUF7694 domain-containing protein n=1 Tax=Vibrio vulnificus TaxID=672 RepID=UPI0002F63745|nr:hypothetical protein [Vibrio vulnificus]KFK55292.1 hypothetical protein JS86_08155 [Vibrio vulnificus]HAS6086791.1 hypothetical protein [Vibrio vulnificus]HAS6390079.1 hypothetical protein [Vibrio vulnificus]HAS6423194.1 hypothetical protein [Vibrio vulnificus]HDY7440448.1 hypothetical protein [Vibrio vulnificus]